MLFHVSSVCKCLLAGAEETCDESDESPAVSTWACSVKGTASGVRGPSSGGRPFKPHPASDVLSDSAFAGKIKISSIEGRHVDP